jgi:hypothetical protein
MGVWWGCIWSSRNIIQTGDKLVKYLDMLCSCNTHDGRIHHDRVSHYVTLKDVSMWTHVMSDCVHNRFPGVSISILACGSSVSGYLVKFDLQPTLRETLSHTRGLWLYIAICATLLYVVYVYEPTLLQCYTRFIIPGKGIPNTTKDEM